MVVYRPGFIRLLLTKTVHYKTVETTLGLTATCGTGCGPKRNLAE
jgi:hypothetical protein